jgi:Flp pilus assembly protein TadG
MVLVVVAAVALFSFVALAVDLGMLAVARTQLQDAADLAAMAGARTLNGDSSANNNYANVQPNALTAATNNTVLSKQIGSGQLSLQIGRYVYVPDNQRFEGVVPGPSSENWSLVTAEITSNMTSQMAFAKIFSAGPTTMRAKATAVHRPRDVAVILDYSGSMRYGSVMGLPFASSSRTSSNNPDTVVPNFGHYSSSSAALVASSFTPLYGEGNISTTTSDGRSAVVADFYSDGSGTAAFTPAPNSYATTPGGDNYLKINNNTGLTYAQTVQGVLNTTSRDNTFETQGYAAYTGQPFNGYTTGPKYWGKTFFIWPPNPVADWRVAYFGTNNNQNLWDSSGNWRTPSNYDIDYTAILNFIKNVGPNPFPSRLQSGRILYYDAIPSSISNSWPPANQNERFWRDYINYVLGLVQYSNTGYDEITDRTGYGDDYTWGTIRISSKPTGNNAPYMDYRDNPKRPRTHFWFGPMTMIDFLGNYNMWYHTRVNPSTSRYCWWPGTCHESPMYACKLGIRAALDDVRTNHPNSLVALMMFSHPKGSYGDDGRFNRPRVGLGRNYTRMQEALWYPPSTLGNSNSTIRPYDDENEEVPRAMGGTCYSMGLMQAYNQFSGNTSLQGFNPSEPSGDAGGNGRRGAQKIVIFETDGMPTHTASASFTNNGAHQSYYRIRYKSGGGSGSEYPSSVNQYSENASAVTSQVYSLCSQLAANETASPPGYSTPSKKVLIHCIGFGPVFAPGSDKRDAALSTLREMQSRGNVSDNMPEYKVIYGTETEMISRMQQAFTQILQDGVQVALVQ